MASRPRMATLLLALVPVFLACGGGDGGAPDDGTGPIRIGAIFDLTGPTADVGTDYADGIRAYVDWLNAQGGVEGRPIELIFQDYGYQVDRAEQLYSQFVQEGVVAFMGWGTGDTEALQPRILEDELPFTSASLSRRLGNPEEAPYNFLVAATYSDQFFIVLDWIKEDFEARGGTGAPVVALMHNASPFGRSPWVQGGEAYAQAIGVEAAPFEMPRGATDFTAELTQIRQTGARYIVFQNTSGPVALALRNAQSLGLDATFVCLNWCSNRMLMSLAPEASQGVVGSMPYAPVTADLPGTADIRAQFQAQGDDLAERTNAVTQGWWTISVLVEGIRRTIAAGQDVTGANIKAALENLRDFDTGGASLPITFSAEDHKGAAGVRLFQVQGTEWIPITDFREPLALDAIADAL